MARILLLLSIASVCIEQILSNNNLGGLTKCVSFFGSGGLDSKREMETFLNDIMGKLPLETKTAIQNDYYKFFDDRKKPFPEYKEPSSFSQLHGKMSKKKNALLEQQRALHKEKEDFYKKELEFIKTLNAPIRQTGTTALKWLNHLVGCYHVCHDYSQHDLHQGTVGDGKEEDVKQEKELCKDLGPKVEDFLRTHEILPKANPVDHAGGHGHHLKDNIHSAGPSSIH